MDVLVAVSHRAYDMGGRCTIRPLALARTDDRGFYRMLGVQPGEHYVAADSIPNRDISTSATSKAFYGGTTNPDRARTIIVSDQKETDRIDFSISRTMTTQVSGRLEVDGEFPAATAFRLEARRVDGCDPGTVALAKNSSAAFVGHVFAAEGSYDLFASIAPTQTGGRQPIDMFRTLMNLSNAKTFGGQTRTEFGNREVTGLLIRMLPLVPWTGRLRIADGSGAIPFTSLQATVVYPDGISEALQFRNRVFSQAPVDARGVFTIQPQADGRQYVFVNVLPDAVYIADIRSGERSVFDTGFDIEAYSATVEIILDTRGGAIEGTVRDDQGQAASFSRVVLVPAERRDNLTLYKTITTDQRGMFRFRGVMPGSYKVFAWQDVPEYAWHNRAFLEPFESQATAVQVKPSDRLTDVSVRVIAR